MKSTEEMLQAAVQQLQTAEQARLTSETDLRAGSCCICSMRGKPPRCNP